MTTQLNALQGAVAGLGLTGADGLGGALTIPPLPTQVPAFACPA